MDIMVDTICHGCIVLPDGRVVDRNGGNPSGNYLTTVINTIYHQVILNCYRRRMLKDNTPVSFLDTKCGDDGVYGGTEKDVRLLVSTFPYYCASVWGIKVKIELDENDDACLKFPEMPTFLGRRCVAVPGTDYTVSVLADTARVLAHYTNRPQGDSRLVFIDRVRGMYDALAGYKVLQRAGYDMAYATDVVEFFAEAEAMPDFQAPSLGKCARLCSDMCF
jgi:hypothetical protein